MQRITIEPKGSGSLDGLDFAVKDLIDLAGYRTSCGNPRWLATHPVAVANAVCVDQLLFSGGRCVGKTITDELAFGLDGENFFYGTPLNPRAPDRVPGGSSSGSASAVACGLADFALGTDTGGSVRVPASNCGILGMRPSHGFISVVGVNPLAPSFDTVGVLARSPDVLKKAASVLLACHVPTQVEVARVHFLVDAFDAADREVREALSEPVEFIKTVFPGKARETSLTDLRVPASENGLRKVVRNLCADPVGGDPELPRFMGGRRTTGVWAQTQSEFSTGPADGSLHHHGGNPTPRGLLPALEGLPRSS